jgi:hypothetical protein
MVMGSMNILQTLTAGDSARWHDDPWIDAPRGLRMTSADWTLTYQLRGATQLGLTAAVDGDGWLTSLSTTDSATLSPGTYVWGAYLSKTGERVTIGGGTLLVKQDLPSLATAIDARTVAQKALDDCEAALASFTSSGGKVKSYTIGNRQTEFHALADLMQLLNYWRLRVANEKAAVSIANGNGNPRHLLVRF